MKKWKKLESKNIYESKWLTLQDHTYLLPNGEKKPGYLHLIRGDYVLIFAVNNKNEVIIERQYRRGLDVFNYELPAGWIDKNETALKAAKRELLEETGYECTPESTYEIYPQPSFMQTTAYVVFCKLGKKVAKLNTAEDEEIEHEIIKIDLLKKRIKSKKIKDMALVCALGIYESIRK